MNRQAKNLQAKAKKNQVAHISQGRYTVTSATSGKEYPVQEKRGGHSCSCRWAKYHDTRINPCTHVLAVEEWLAQASGRSLSFWANDEDAKRQHRPTELVGVGLLATARRV